MAKIKSSILIKKYGTTNIRNGKYKALMDDVIANNSESINRAILRITKKNYEDALSKITTRAKPFDMPSIESVLPKRSVFLKKSAEKGQFITDTLKDKLTSDLRQSLAEWVKKPRTRKFFSRKDKLDAGIINDFQNRIMDTFTSYTKRDKKYGVPSNIRNIAVTEIRSNINEIKYAYTDRLLKNNVNLEAKKRWRHNKRLSKKYRFGHFQANGQTVNMNEDFVINTYKEIKGQLHFAGVVRCSHPHDSRLPLSEIISCSCDYDIIIKKIKNS